jgi:hypothetical protein
MINLNLNVLNFAKNLIPKKIRDEVTISWLGAKLNPLQNLNNTFAFYAKKTRYDLSFTGQVIYLEHVLNDVFDPVNRSIYIEDPTPSNIDNTYVFYGVENQILPYVYYDAEGVASPYLLYELEFFGIPDFIVWIPSQVMNSQNEPKIRAIINKYKQAGKFYKIRVF